MRCSLLAAGLALVAAGCVKRVETSTATLEVDELRREDALRRADNLPPGFVVVTAPATPRDCPPALRDGASGTRLTLRRSLLIPVQDSTGIAYRPFGDYSLEPAGRYGDREGEALRVDCTSLRGIGIVVLVVRLP